MATKRGARQPNPLRPAVKTGRPPGPHPTRSLKSAYAYLERKRRGNQFEIVMAFANRLAIGSSGSRATRDAKAFDALLAGAEEMLRVIQSVDDLGGYCPPSMFDARSVLQELVAELRPGKTRRELLKRAPDNRLALALTSLEFIPSLSASELMAIAVASEIEGPTEDRRGRLLNWTQRRRTALAKLSPAPPVAVFRPAI